MNLSFLLLADYLHPFFSSSSGHLHHVCNYPGANTYIFNTLFFYHQISKAGQVGVNLVSLFSSACWLLLFAWLSRYLHCMHDQLKADTYVFFFHFNVSNHHIPMSEQTGMNLLSLLTTVCSLLFPRFSCLHHMLDRLETNI